MDTQEIDAELQVSALITFIFFIYYYMTQIEDAMYM